MAGQMNASFAWAKGGGRLRGGEGRGKIPGKPLRLTVKFTWGVFVSVAVWPLAPGRQGKHGGGSWRLFGTLAFGLFAAWHTTLGFTCSNRAGFVPHRASLAPQRGWDASHKRLWRIKTSAAGLHLFRDWTDEVTATFESSWVGSFFSKPSYVCTKHNKKNQR